MSMNKAIVYQDPVNHLTGTQRMRLLKAAILYGEQKQNEITQNPTIQQTQQNHASSTYLARRKAQIIAGSNNVSNKRPPQSSIVTNLQALGC